jgi:hypothetical protein
MSSGEPATAPYFGYDFDRKRRRVHMRYTGFWSAPVAWGVLRAFRSVLEIVSAQGRPFTLLDDCREWGPQSKEVSEIAKKFVDICRDFPITRNAMIIPSALVRMQVRRTLVDFDICEIFETYEQADTWLAEVEPAA